MFLITCINYHPVIQKLFRGVKYYKSLHIITSLMLLKHQILHQFHFCVRFNKKTKDVSPASLLEHASILFWQHSLLEAESTVVRTAITNALVSVRSFGEEVRDMVRKIGSSIQQMEGGYTASHENTSHQVSFEYISCVGKCLLGVYKRFEGQLLSLNLVN